MKTEQDKIIEAKNLIGDVDLMDLRKLAAHAKVKLPTTMKKVELVDAIIDVVSGKAAPYVKLKKGRGSLEAKISDDILTAYKRLRNIFSDRPLLRDVTEDSDGDGQAEDVEVLPLDKVESITPAEKAPAPFAPGGGPRSGGYQNNRQGQGYEQRPGGYANRQQGQGNEQRPGGYQNNRQQGQSYEQRPGFGGNRQQQVQGFEQRQAFGGGSRQQGQSYEQRPGGYANRQQPKDYDRRADDGDFDENEAGDFALDRKKDDGYGRPDVPKPEGPEVREGVLEIHTNGFGFIRAKNYEPGDGDAFVRTEIIKSNGLRKGDWLKGVTFRQRNEGNVALGDNIYINGRPAAGYIRRPVFEDLTPIYPNSRLTMELPGGRSEIAMRCIDLIAPIGKGQRGIIVSPPKAGKTTVLKQIANSITANNPDVHLIVLLIDERPEEVTDMQRSVRGEVVYSTFDEQPDHHTRAAELVLARAKRLVELGRDVVILLDSLTRLARAYNITIEASGKTLSGGIDPAALHNPKRFFGAARNIENGGSLTIIATALVDTGSRMDEVIFEEFKGTGNMEIHLDRKLSEKRIFPAIDLNKSSTRREDLLLTQKELEGIWSIRKILSVGDTQEATEQLITMMLRTKTNMEFIDTLQGWLKSLK